MTAWVMSQFRELERTRSFTQTRFKNYAALWIAVSIKRWRWKPRKKASINVETRATNPVKITFGIEQTLLSIRVLRKARWTTTNKLKCVGMMLHSLRRSNLNSPYSKTTDEVSINLGEL